jgi:hypothetical protein
VKMRKYYLLVMVLFLPLLFQSNAFAASHLATEPPSIQGDQVIMGKSFTLLENQNLLGDLAIIGGSAHLKPGSRVSGDIAVFGGTLEIEGMITGNLFAMGGTINMGKGAVLNGDFINFGSELTRAAGTDIKGSQISNLPFQLDLGEFNPPDFYKLPFYAARETTRVVMEILWAMLQIIFMGGLAMLVVLIAPKASNRIANTIGEKPITHWVVGLLTMMVFPIVTIICFVTIVFIPVGFLAIMVFVLASIYGWIAMGYEIGKRLFAMSSKMSPAIIAGIGTIILSLVIRILSSIPCIGWLFPMLTSMFGIGAVVLTRFGTRNYPDQPTIPSAPVDNPQLPANED